MKNVGIILTALILLGWTAEALAAQNPPAAPQAVEFFESRIRPVLAEHCWSCHGDKKQKGGLRLDSRAVVLQGGENGQAVVPGEPDRSLLVRAVRYTGETKMPPKGKLPKETVEALTTWVRLGAPWSVDAATAPMRHDQQASAEAGKIHWAFQPVRKPALPAVHHAAWVKTPLDAFVLAGLEAKGLAPAPPADRGTLLRRVTFDLIGLPPTPEEVTAFEADPSPEAYARVVELLLASSHYGERWGRHWLDVARYADTKGYVFTEERRFPFAYTYRDYVIRALNEDLPYDQFVLQQIAADRLPVGADKRPLAAMGFLTLGRRFLNNKPDIIDDRIDVVCRGLLGLTVACARCHDHKYDPIPSRDYYSLYGVFASSIEPKDLPVLAAPMESPAYQAYQKELVALKEEATHYEEEHKPDLQSGNRAIRDELRKRQKKIDQLRVTHPGVPPSAMVLVDAPQAIQPHVFLRGNPNNQGEAVPRQFLACLAGPQRQPFKEGSGRLELARAIASRDNPLTARVMVNRAWQHHFGKGLVRTPGNFGLRGEAPTHPELLDWLAATFMEEGWSLKQLHRQILLSATYQQSCDGDPRLEQLDADNRLLGRMERRRLDFEALRDALLAVAGRLDPVMDGPPVDLLKTPFTHRRTVYGFIDRQNLPSLFRTFDFASPDTCTAQRHETTVPQQSLFLMNSPFVVEQTQHLLGRAQVLAQKDETDRIIYLYRLLYGRAPELEEVRLGLRFMDTATGGNSLTAWQKYVQVLLLANEFAFLD